MKALSLTQPWASLIAIGAKRIETRSWETRYRGRLAIHAATGFPNDAKRLCLEHPFLDMLYPAGLVGAGSLPLGAIVAVAVLRSVREIAADLPSAYGEAFPNAVWHTAGEVPFGDYAPGRFAWLLDGVVRLPEPIPCKGALGLWIVPSVVANQIPLEACR